MVFQALRLFPRAYYTAIEDNIWLELSYLYRGWIKFVQLYIYMCVKVVKREGGEDPSKCEHVL